MERIPFLYVLLVVHHKFHMKYLLGKSALLFCLLLLPVSVFAHKVNIFASAEGNVITGYVYYTGGGNPKQATLVVEDQQGNRLGEVETDENGEFSFSAETRQNHLFILELADGHRASFTVKAEELPESLATAESSALQPRSADEAAVPQKEGTAATVPDSSAQEELSLQISAAELEALIDKAVSKQIRPLREQLDQYEAKVRLHDILGGIGYIAGLMGLWYFLSSRKTRA